MAKATEMKLRVLYEITECTNNNGVEIIYKIPRKYLAKCVDINELGHGGIYLLLGERNGHQMIYIGHSVGRLFDKLCEHDRTDKNFWTEAIVFTTADNSFGAREIIWLEDKFSVELQGAGRLVTRIGKDEKTADFEARAEFARVTLNTIGYKIFEPTENAAPDEEIFYLKNTNRKVNARMKCTPNGFTVLTGSEICLVDTKYLPKSLKDRRASAKVDANSKLLANEDFDSPSGAAQFVLGRSSNGREAWKTADGLMLKEVFGR